MTFAIPTIAGIQRANAILAAALSLIVLVFASPHLAIGFAVGAASMIANLFLLAIVGRWIVAVAARGGGASRLGIIAAPLKLLFIVTVVALLLSRTKLSAAGFVLGALTQPAAIFIETWRASSLAAWRSRGDAGVQV
jgi:hypothetical protein